MDTEKLEIAYEAESALEAQAVQDLLDEAGITFTTRSVGLSPLLGGSSDGTGLNDTTQILVHPGDLAKAQEAILNYQSPE